MAVAEGGAERLLLEWRLRWARALGLAPAPDEGVALIAEPVPGYGAKKRHGNMSCIHAQSAADLINV